MIPKAPSKPDSAPDPTLRRAVAVYVSILRTTDQLQAEVADVLKAAGLTSVQYNVLRILRGVHPAGRSCSEIGGELIQRDPDVTRLLDRMESRGLVARHRDEKDRRVILTRITEAGLEALRTLDEPVAELHRRQFAHLSIGDMRDLMRLLESARNREP